MPSTVFQYRARQEADGRVVRSTIRAESKADAFTILRDQGKLAFEILHRTTQFSSGRKRTSAIQRIAFFRSFAQLDKVGVDMSTTFNILMDQTNGKGGGLQWQPPWAKRSAKRFRETIRGIRSDLLDHGLQLNEALARRDDDFTDLEVAMIAAGEAAGKRPEVCMLLADFLENDRKQRRAITVAILNPVMLFVLAFFVFIYLTAFVIPQFAFFYKQYDVALPAIMQYMLVVAEIMRNPIALGVIVGWLVVSGYFTWAIGRTDWGAVAFDKIRLRMPIFGNLIYKAITIRFSRVVSILLMAGIDRIKTFEVATPVVNSPFFAKALIDAKNRLVLGQVATLAETLEETNLFEAMFIGFVQTGERTGKIPEMLDKLGDFYEDDAATIIAALPATLQNVLTVLMGIGIGFISFIVYVPLTTLVSRIH